VHRRAAVDAADQWARRGTLSSYVGPSFWRGLEARESVKSSDKIIAGVADNGEVYEFAM